LAAGFFGIGITFAVGAATATGAGIGAVDIGVGIAITLATADLAATVFFFVALDFVGILLSRFLWLAAALRCAFAVSI